MDAKSECEVDVEGIVDMMDHGEGEEVMGSWERESIIERASACQ